VLSHWGDGSGAMAWLDSPQCSSSAACDGAGSMVFSNLAVTGATLPTSTPTPVPAPVPTPAGTWTISSVTTGSTIPRTGSFNVVVNYNFPQSSKLTVDILDSINSWAWLGSGSVDISVSGQGQKTISVTVSGTITVNTGVKLKAWVVTTSDATQANAWQLAQTSLIVDVTVASSPTTPNPPPPVPAPGGSCSGVGYKQAPANGWWLAVGGVPAPTASLPTIYVNCATGPRMTCTTANYNANWPAWQCTAGSAECIGPRTLTFGSTTCPLSDTVFASATETVSVADPSTSTQVQTTTTTTTTTDEVPGWGAALIALGAIGVVVLLFVLGAVLMRKPVGEHI